jgi:hypothetical protein
MEIAPSRLMRARFQQRIDDPSDGVLPLVTLHSTLFFPYAEVSVSASSPARE